MLGGPFWFTYSRRGAWIVEIPVTPACMTYVTVHVDGFTSITTGCCR